MSRSIDARVGRFTAGDDEVRRVERLHKLWVAKAGSLVLDQWGYEVTDESRTAMPRVVLFEVFRQQDEDEHEMAAEKLAFYSDKDLPAPIMHFGVASIEQIETFIDLANRRE